MFQFLILILINLAAIKPVPAPPLGIMTFNIRYDNPQDGINKWDNRKNVIIGIFENHKPDIIGIQEGLDNQVNYLQDKLPNFSFVGVGRDDGKKKGEYSAIFYRKERIKLISSSTFWLSDSPDKPSKGWDAALERICTYALFQDKVTQTQFWILNTHFDHQGEVARLKSAKLILSKVTELRNQNDIPVIIMGDFNATEITEPIVTIKTEFSDSRELSKNSPLGPNYTYNAFNTKEAGTDRIDFIFVDKNCSIVSDYIVIDEQLNDRYPSDHFPVFVKLSF